MTPEVVIGPPVKVRPVEPPETSTLVTVPAFEVIQFPVWSLKQPALNCIPLAKVEEAVAEVMLSLAACTPQPKEEVAVVEVAVR